MSVLVTVMWVGLPVVSLSVCICLCFERNTAQAIDPKLSRYIGHDRPTACIDSEVKDQGLGL